MILVRRGTLAAVEDAMRGRYGLALPAAGRCTTGGGVTLLWHGPDRFLAMRDGGDATLASELASAFVAAAYVVEASASRLVLAVSGTGAGEALSRHLPIDLHPRVFTPGSVALTRSAHIDVLVWREADAPWFGLACASSYRDSFRRSLSLR
jgi:sarcosine oxidase subunit gamma